MREINRHSIKHYMNKDVEDEGIKIRVVDEPGAGGASHEYDVEVPLIMGGIPGYKTTSIKFQKGPIKENGINGLTNEVLLSIVEDRLLSFQEGAFACNANERALTNIQRAINILHERTRDRMERGVEGKDKK